VGLLLWAHVGKERQTNRWTDTVSLHRTLSEMPTSIALPTSHHFHQSLSPVVSLSLGILHDWMRMQMLAKQSSNLPGELEATTRLAAHKLDEEHS